MRDGWVVATLGEVCNIQQGKTLAISNLGSGPYPVFGANGVVGYHHEYNFNYEVTALGCRGSCGTIHYIEEPAFLANNVMALWPRDISILVARFLPLALANLDLFGSGAISGQVQPQITKQGLQPVEMFIPPLAEQGRIVDLISTVDSYIDALRQQLEKAKESRGAVLHELLTAGGDGWVKTPIGEVAQVLSGFAFKSEHFNKSEGMPLIRIRDLPKRNHTEALYSGSYEDRYVVRQGDFLIGMDGEFHCYEWSGPDALLNQRVCRIQDFKRNLVEPRFIYFAINQYLDKIEQDTGYTTVKHISSKQILGITIPLPPLLEQKQIVDLISTVDSHTDAIQDQLASSASLRSALVADLLSGNHEIPASYDQLIGAA